MKKSVLKVVLIVMTVMLVLAIFSSCNKDGEQGPAGPAGPQGNDGNGIESILKTFTEGFVDTYTITFTDGTTTTFTVTNGCDGEQGIQVIRGEKGEDGHTPVITIQNGKWYIDGVDSGKTAEGVKGDTGNGISSIAKTNTVGLVDTYTITFTNGETTTFTVTNGADGAQGQQGNIGANGRGIVSTELINGELIITYTDGTKENLGKIFSPDNSMAGYAHEVVLTSTNDTTDRLAEIQALIDTYGYAKLGKGEFYLSGQLRIRNGATIDGCGEATVIKQTSDTEVTAMIWLQSEGTIRNVCLQGEWTSAPTAETTPDKWRCGIIITGGTNNAIIDGCWIRGWTSKGVYAIDNGTATRSFLMSNCDVCWCNTGLYLEETEYACVSNCVFRSNKCGVDNRGGNNKFSACGFDINIEGFRLMSGYNNGHGSAVGCTFNHNTSRAVSVSNMEIGFVFSACQFHDGCIANNTGKGLLFSGCQFGRLMKYYNYTASPTMFVGCIFSQTPQTEATEFLDEYNGLRFVNCINYLTGEVINDADIPKLGYSTPEMYSAIGDGVNDDAGAFTNAINDSDCVFLTSDLYLFTPVAISGKLDW